MTRLSPAHALCCVAALLATAGSTAVAAAQDVPATPTAAAQDEAAAIVDVFFNPPLKDAFCSWMDSQLRDFVRETLADLEANAAGVTDHVLATAMSASAANCPDDVASLARSQVEFLRSRWPSAALRPLASYFRSAAGRRYVSLVTGSALRASAEQRGLPPEEVDALIASLSDRERADLARVENGTPSLAAVLLSLSDNQTVLVTELLMRRSRELEAPVRSAVEAFATAHAPRPG